MLYCTVGCRHCTHMQPEPFPLRELPLRLQHLASRHVLLLTSCHFIDSASGQMWRNGAKPFLASTSTWTWGTSHAYDNEGARRVHLQMSNIALEKPRVESKECRWVSLTLSLYCRWTWVQWLENEALQQTSLFVNVDRLQNEWLVIFNCRSPATLWPLCLDQHMLWLSRSCVCVITKPLLHLRTVSTPGTCTFPFSDSLLWRRCWKTEKLQWQRVQ